MHPNMKGGCFLKKCIKIYQLIIIQKIKKTTKKACERYQNLSKEEKNSNNMVVSITKFSQKMKKINWLTIEKNIIE